MEPGSSYEKYSLSNKIYDEINKNKGQSMDSEMCEDHCLGNFKWYANQAHKTQHLSIMVSSTDTF